MYVVLPVVLLPASGASATVMVAAYLSPHLTVMLLLWVQSVKVSL